ncbi:MAG: hypothetical protein HY811_07350 [Planctomycetes bacterium]|nr:hypothetical protein [Planctomycetota bacterium]
MGTPIIYCSKCREMIPPADISAGKIIEIDGRNFCYKCSLALSQGQASPPSKPAVRPPAPKQTPAARPISATQPAKPSGIRPAGVKPTVTRPLGSPPALHKPGVFPSTVKGTSRQKPVSGLRKPQPSRVASSEENDDFEVVDKKPSSKKYLVGGIVAVVVIALVAIIFVFSGNDDKDKQEKTSKKNPKKTSLTDATKSPSSKSPDKSTTTTPPVSKEEALANAKKAFEEIEAYESKNPLESKEILKRIKNSIGLMANTPYEEPIKKKQTEHDEKEFIIREVRDYYDSFEGAKNKGETIDYDYYMKNLTELKEKAEKTTNNTELLKFTDDQIAKVQEGQKGEGLQKLSDLKKNVDEFLGKESFEMAKSECNNFPEGYKSDPAIAQEIDKLVEKINQAEQAYIKKKKEEGEVLYDGGQPDTSKWIPFGLPPKMEVLDDNTLSLENISGQESYIFMGETSWVNYTVEVEYKVVQGALNMLMRFDYEPLKQQPPSNPKPPVEYPLKRTPGDESWKKITLGINDKTLTVKQDDKPEEKKTLNQDSATNGAFGFALRAGDKIIIKRIKVKGIE